MWPFNRKKNKIFQRDDSVLDLEAHIGPRRREHVRKFCGAVGVTLAVLMVGWGLWWASDAMYNEWVLKNDAIALRNLEIRNDGLITPAQLKQWARVEEGQNLFALDLHQIKQNLELIPFIEHAAVERIFPETLKIHVKERQPVARIHAYQKSGVRLEPQVFYIDRFGYLLLPLQEQAEAWSRMGQTMPAISGIRPDLLRPGSPIQVIEMRSALELIVGFSKSPLARTTSMKNVDLSEGHALRVSTGTGGEIVFALDNINGQLRRWHLIQDFGLRQQKLLASLDLAVTNYVPVRWLSPAEPADPAKQEKPPEQPTPAPGRKRHV